MLINFPIINIYLVHQGLKINERFTPRKEGKLKNNWRVATPNESDKKFETDAKKSFLSYLKDMLL